ncbi:hypothetical protein BJ878DRAFT_503142 [Calycina marina]|uniref:Thioredoxin domain-containing protein n=1 Tax=Calycina marina TaxID=1763456 RepID=A0A9P7Z539_9HELO|nr:hypothetical protein BJ878DRAFT_503142 [Calycina marina]
MPIEISTASPSSLASAIRSPSSLENTDPTDPTDPQPQYIIFLASLLNRTSWCPDCRVVEPLIDRYFQGNGEAVRNARVIYVGDRATWKDPTNKWRQEPFYISGVPTILKVVGEKWERLYDDDVVNEAKLKAFLGVN